MNCLEIQDIASEIIKFDFLKNSLHCVKRFFGHGIGRKIMPHTLCTIFEKLVYEATKYVCHCDLAIIVTTMGYVLP